MLRVKTTHWVYLIIFFAVIVWSAIGTFDPMLWVLEAGICVVGLICIVVTYRRFPLTEMTYVFILLHCIVLLIGAHYSYAKVPAFDWLKDVMNSDRNNFDKVGHFMQGFVPAMIAREILIRLEVLKRKSWLPFIVISICLAISALYELIEWWVALLSEDGAEDFLGMQGYEWDTQSDMFLALIGSVVMLILFSKGQNKQIENLNKKGIGAI